MFKSRAVLNCLAGIAKPELPIPLHSGEQRWRRLSAVAFLLIMLIFGVPLWWQTTKTYQASFDIFPHDVIIQLPVFVRLVYTNRELDGAVQWASTALNRALIELPDIERLNIQWHIEAIAVDDLHQLPSNSTALTLLILDTAQWPFYSADVLYFGGESTVSVQYSPDGDRLVQRLLSAVKDVLVDVDHLGVIVNRDLKKRLQPWQLATLPSSQQKRRIWDSAALAADYRIQVIFGHETGSAIDPEVENRVLSSLDWMKNRLAGVVQLDIVSEHLWDLDLSSWTDTDVQQRKVIKASHVPQLLSTIDAQLSTIESSQSLLKLLILHTATTNNVHLLDYMGEDSPGNTLVVASWGSITMAMESDTSDVISVAILGSMRVLLGLDTELPVNSGRDTVALADWELWRMRMRSFVDNAMHTISSVEAMRRLADGISNVVVSDEVADTVTKAVHEASQALNKAAKSPLSPLDVEGMQKARALSDRALFHRSLLALLYFPEDQKYAIYLPLFLPTMLPVLGSLLALHAWLQPFLVSRRE